MRRLSCALRHQQQWEVERALQRLDESRVAQQREIGMLERALRDDERVPGTLDGFDHEHLGDLHRVEVVLVSRGPEFALQKLTDKLQLVFIEWRRRGVIIVGHRRGTMHEQCRERRTYYFAELHPEGPTLWPGCHEPRRDLRCRIFVPSRVIGARNRRARGLPGAVCALPEPTGNRS
jgi:hypothetical protein